MIGWCVWAGEPREVGPATVVHERAGRGLGFGGLGLVVWIGLLVRYVRALDVNGR